MSVSPAVRFLVDTPYPTFLRRQTLNLQSGNGKLDNVGAASGVAVDTDTGKVPWRYTAVPGDPWDCDTMQTPLIITLTAAGPSCRGSVACPGWGYEEHGLEHGNLIVALSR